MAFDQLEDNRAFPGQSYDSVALTQFSRFTPVDRKLWAAVGARIEQLPYTVCIKTTRERKGVLTIWLSARNKLAWDKKMSVEYTDPDGRLVRRVDARPPPSPPFANSPHGAMASLTTQTTDDTANPRVQWISGVPISEDEWCEVGEFIEKHNGRVYVEVRPYTVGGLTGCVCITVCCENEQTLRDRWTAYMAHLAAKKKDPPPPYTAAPARRPVPNVSPLEVICGYLAVGCVLGLATADSITTMAVIVGVWAMIGLCMV